MNSKAFKIILTNGEKVFDNKEEADIFFNTNKENINLYTYEEWDEKGKRIPKEVFYGKVDDSCWK